MRSKGLSFVLVIAMLVGGIGIAAGGEPEPPAPHASPLNFAMLWHMHQPLYKNILTGKYEMPWVRDHTPEEYLDHPKILMAHPAVNATFNLVPSLILQIEDYVAGAVDNHIDLARIDLATATPEQRRAIASEFIRLAPWHYTRNTTDGRIVNPWYDTYAAWPRLNALVAKVSADPGGLNDTELADLETIFFLHQISIPYIEGRYNASERDASIIALLQKGTGYTQADTEAVLAAQRAIMGRVVGFYKDAQDRGQAEVITTPFYHPIAPLLIDAVVPSEDAVHDIAKGSWEKDARYQFVNATTFHAARFGAAPAGVWHSEQSVSPLSIMAARDAGFTWTSSDEAVLWASDVGAQRVGVSLLNRSTVYTVTEQGRTMTIVFRDTDLSNKVSFSYGGLPTDQAVQDFMRILRGYHDNMTVAQRADRLVTLAADGENWMFMAGYPNDGRDFLNALYENLTAAQAAGWLQTWRIGDFVSRPIAKTPLSRLHAGSWIDADFRTWSGEEEEQVGWARLAAARKAVVDYTLATEGRDFVDPSSSPAVKRAWEAIFTAEGSDWFWWYGDDQSSGDDGKFDFMLKAHLVTAYATIGEVPPADVTATWGAAAPPTQPGTVAEESLPPTVDGVAAPGEWANATGWTKTATGGLMQMKGLYAFADAASLTVRIDLNGDATILRGTTGQDVDLYLSHPVRFAERDMEVNLNRYGVNFASKNGGYTFDWAARYRIRVVFSQSLSTGVTPWSLFTGGEGPTFLGDGTWTFKSGKDNGVAVGPVIELIVPLADMEMGPGDVFRLVAVTTSGPTEVDLLPQAGPGEVQVLIPRPGPPIAIFADPLGDDVGDGDYTYAQSPDFRCSDGTHCEDHLYDFRFFNVSDAPTSITLTIGYEDIGQNPWNGPNGFAYQIVNVYFDTDRVPSSGHRDMLTGANAQVTPEFAWEAAVQAAGWSDARTFVTRDPGVTQRLQSGLLVRRAPGTQNVEITIPKSLLPAGDPKSWGYVVVSGMQDGFGPGWWRPVAALSGTWVGGGAGQPSKGIPPGNHHRIYDVILPQGADQNAVLGSYTASALAQVPGVTIEVKAPGTPAVTVAPAAPWDRNDTVTVSWTAQPNPETNRPIESYDVSVFYTATDVIKELPATTLTQTTFTVTKEQDVTIRVTAFDGFATSAPFVQTYEVTKTPPPPPENHAPVLTNPGVEPTDGDDRTVFLFSVRYVDADGDAPLVNLVLGTRVVAMAYVGGGNATGAIYRVSLTLAAGTHTYKFVADDRNGTATSVVETETFTLTVRSAGGAASSVVVIGVTIGAVAAVAAYALLFRRRPPKVEAEVPEAPAPKEEAPEPETEPEIAEVDEGGG